MCNDKYKNRGMTSFCMKNTLERRIILFSFLILFLTILANTGMDIVGFRRDYIKALILRSQSIGTSLKGSVEKVVGLGLDIKDIQGVQEKCAELVQANPDIVYCVISDQEGNILYLSDPFFNNLRFDIVNRFFSGDARHKTNLIGRDIRYYDTVTPINSPDGKKVAVIHIGFPEHNVSDKVMKMVIRSLFILLFFFLVSFTLVVFFVKKCISQPVSALLNGVKKIAAGSFNTRIPELSLFEFNELAKNFNFMSESLENRAEEIRDNYHELEKAHMELHSSYMRLETLSLELEKSETLYKSFMEDASDVIVVIGDDEVVMMVNKMAEEFFGYPSNRIVGLALTKMLQLIKTVNIPRAYEIFQAAFNGMHVDEEIQFERKGERLVGRMHATSIKSGEERLVQAIIRDVTREKETINNLEKSASDLARLNKMKDSFLGLASHELKTPLTVIMGYSELILSDMADKMDNSVVSMVENIANAASRLDSIVKDMVDVSMIDQKRLQLKMEDVNLNRLVETSANELRFFFNLRNQEMVMDLDESIPLIKGDSIRLIQLISNVMGNAIKFTPDGGRVTVATRLRHLLRSKQTEPGELTHVFVNIGKERHPYVELTVTDTGIGIDVEDQLRIFEKFYEVGNIEEHSSGKVAFKGKGTGLGLAIAKGIVEMHSGDIWVESKGYDHVSYPGSTFHIILPLDPVIGDASIDYLNLLG